MPAAVPARSPAIALAAGGTGGHLFPAEALARELMARGRAVVLYTERRGAAYAQALDGIPHVVLPARSLAGGVAGKLAAAWTILHAASHARADMRRRGVGAVVGFGGYPSFAPALAGKSLGLPLLLHEQATRMSLANRQLLRLAGGVAASFEEVAGLGGFDRRRVVVTGNPVRRAILDARGPYPPLGADGPLRVLVVGGSQSARVFGEVVPPAVLALPDALRRRVALSLQYRGEDAGEVAARLRDAGVAVDIRPFFDDMGVRVREAHLVIARAGATTAADLLAIGRPAIFVPIPQGGSREEQLRNARALAAAGVGWCIEERDLAPAPLALRLEALLSSPSALPEAAAAAARLGRPDAAARLADVVEGLAGLGP
jgi:UDP-N-acetylglucosamine--N-acetylmuramyl-(pentapeptide) pyrophosphoryl-undecaprenol N-acetylglucosamine transferase